MSDVLWATPLYEYLRQCEALSLDRTILDCGAGGREPPLSLFHRHGFRTYGVEIALDPLRDATQFCREHGMPRTIFRGDMRQLPFADTTFSFAYSYNAIFFMTKPDIARSMSEMARVLRPGGLLYVNFLSVDDPDRRPFCETSPLRPWLGSEHFAHHEDREPDIYFHNFEIQRWEKRFVDKVHGYGRLKQVYLEYTARKRGSDGEKQRARTAPGHARPSRAVEDIRSLRSVSRPEQRRGKGQGD